MFLLWKLKKHRQKESNKVKVMEVFVFRKSYCLEWDYSSQITWIVVFSDARSSLSLCVISDQYFQWKLSFNPIH